MQISFYPEWDEPKLIAAAGEYEEIWSARGDDFISVLEKRTELDFVESRLNVLIYEGVSYSHPTVLRASYPIDIKATTLVHELGHRILAGSGFGYKRAEDRHINGHKLLYLILFDVFVELFGEDKAQRAVEWESGLRPSYKNCWQWALNLSEPERAHRFSTIKYNKEDWEAYLDRNSK